MKLFKLSRAGNDLDELMYDKNTNYLVFANDHEEAAALVLEQEKRLNFIFELGESTGHVEKPHIYRGPFFADVRYVQFSDQPGWVWIRCMENCGDPEEEGWPEEQGTGRWYFTDERFFDYRWLPRADHELCAAEVAKYKGIEEVLRDEVYPMRVFEVACPFRESDDQNWRNHYIVIARDHNEATKLMRPPILFSGERDVVLISELAVSPRRFSSAGTFFDYPYDANYESPAYHPHAQLHEWHCRLVKTDSSFNSLKFEFWLRGPEFRDEVTTCFYPNGRMAARCEWSNGKRNGKSEYWFSNGVVMHEGGYQDDMPHGMHQWWYDSYSQMYQGEFHAGKPVGLHERWLEDGTPVPSTEHAP